MTFRQFTGSRTFFIGILALAIILIKVCALNPFFIEKHFATGFFAGFSVFLRTLTAWIPFSVGDILYFFTGVWLLYTCIHFIVKIIRNKARLTVFLQSILKVLLMAAIVYLIFNVFWGLNYNRKGIAWQLQLETKKYTDDDLKNIQQLLIKKVNESKQIFIDKHSVYPTDRELFARSNKCYQQTAVLYPFMKYKNASIKTSLFSWWGNFLGFTGYYNPFTGEAQLNTTVPRFVLPYTTCHEVAHQLGYAKEDEANFAGYLAATTSTDNLFHYSTYLDLFVYANNDVYYVDSVAAKQAYKQLLPEVRSDIKEWKDFLIKHRSFADAFVTWAYGKYLKANQQPQGMRTYSGVIGDLIAFYKKTGKI